MTKCLFFDCDGTLIDSETVCNKSLSLEFSKAGIHIEPESLTQFRGWELAKIFQTISSEFKKELPATIRDDYRSTMHDLFDTELNPIEGIHLTLENLDHPKAIVSSAPREKILHGLEICDLLKYFDHKHIYSAYDLNIWKPDPKIYIHAAHDMGYSEDQCIVIEDSLTGVEAGYNANMLTFFFNQYQDLCAFPGVITFESMRELPRLIKAHI